MTPAEFIAKWSEVTTLERATVQSHFNDLCKLLDEKTPHDADPAGEWYAFEKGVEKTGAGRGWADVWKRGCFGWEYKSKSGGRESTLARALKQLQQYALALESPPLLVVSDIDIIEIHTAFQNAVQEVHTIRLGDIGEAENLRKLKWLLNEPERLRPRRTRNQITADAAGQFAELAFALRADSHDPQLVAHYLNRLLFCMFAEDAGLLKSDLFTELAEKGTEHPEHFDTFIKRLFQAMQTGGPFGTEIIDWFNGGLFDNDDTIPLSLSQIRQVRDLARMDWSQIEPAIFGTLFERGLDPDKRSQLGAHYTDPDSIMRLVNPTIVEPLLDEWRAVRDEISKQMQRMEKVKTKAAAQKRLQAASGAFQGYLERLRNFRVLDPACGSGNFLYLALQALKDIEHRANIEAEALGLQRQVVPLVGPEAVLGIELNSYAAELARVTVWIGEIQWMLDKGYSLHREPILKPLDTIEQGDALIQEDRTETSWPAADVVIGNPPFLGNKKMIAELGEEYVGKLRETFNGRLAGGVDLVMYWYEKARAQVEAGSASRVGFVATNSIRAGSNRKVLEKIQAKNVIFNAWSDEPWINEGAAVRVSLVCFTPRPFTGEIILNGQATAAIRADLTGAEGQDSADVTTARRLAENTRVAFQGPVKVGNFDIPGDLAREWLVSPNPHGRPNSEVLKPWVNGSDITKRLTGKWIIDFGAAMSEADAACYEKPFAHVKENVRPQRLAQRDKGRKERWWIHGRTGEDMRTALDGLSRYIATPRVAKHRLFVWQDMPVWPDSRVYAIASESDAIFGILHSRVHEVWTLAVCSWHGVGNDPTYNASTFEMFPFPSGLTPNLEASSFTNTDEANIAEAAKALVSLRGNWLNPPEWADRAPEVVEGYPERLIPKKGHENQLKKRTLTNLYNEKPSWLENAHRLLDEAVTSAYGWSADLSDEEILKNLLKLNQSRTPT